MNKPTKRSPHQTKSGKRRANRPPFDPFSMENLEVLKLHATVFLLGRNLPVGTPYLNFSNYGGWK
jgi:hypothetical protein